MLNTLYTCTYGSIYESFYFAKYICFIFSLYYSSVRDNQVGKKDCRWNRIHSFLQESELCICNQSSDH